MFLVNAFSANMIKDDVLLQGFNVDYKPIPKDLIPSYLESAIGHADTAHVLSSVLGREVKPNRINVKVGFEDTLILAQYIGTRLQEGATTLPEGARILFFRVTVNPFSILPSDF